MHILQLGGILASLATLAGAVPPAALKRQVSQLRSNYDFVIVGGGTSGLTVADRLSAAFPAKTVLVIEYGEIEFAPGVFDPPTLWITAAPDQASSWTFQSLPNPEMNNKTAFVLAGQVVGGSSAVNGMFFDRGSRFDYDSWTEAAGPDSSGIRWNWQGIFPFFKKSVTFTKPTAAVAQKYGYTWDVSAYGGSTPIYASFGPFQWADQQLLRKTWDELGIKSRKECAGGDKEGVCWVPSSQHPVTARRSHAGLGHYADATRPNYDLLVKHQVVRVVYPQGLSLGPPRVEVRSLADNQLFNVTAKAEVVISAGALHTPTVLQRSGIGSASVLGAAGIPVVLDLPGVGANLHDHSGAPVTWEYTTPGNFSPLPSDMLDPVFFANATAGFDEIPAQGPYTMAGGNSAIYVSLPHMTTNKKLKSIIKKIRDLASNTALASSYLPADYRTNPTMIAGYKAQLLALANLLSDPDAPSLETPWATGGTAYGFLLHPLSRGTVRLDPADHLAQPILDYRAGTNPIDFDLHLAHTQFLRKLINTPTMQQYGAVETAPGAGVSGDAALVEYIKEQIVLSFMHPCCTAAMLPKAKGGVVGPDLKVHGAKGLRVVDMSVMPLVPGSHLSATAYAVGEKASAIIIDAWSHGH
ncbi:hypothetical protein B0H67DRAFT_149205 [Lasiosphaeris hirsuta]|uniref:Glucose-methanol-choline oxidoreductase N-terminal domain-containing protein n=1 Tax=Lasiosphaeris hirsuta TaxID=260670 RepID=A0AA40ANU5_9PEZI|nr:hypothetical protein B0H67DRAFT_149205 [Lasiosphaeris hirsuta]